MKLSAFITALRKLEAEYGDLEVFTTHGASGAVDEVGSPCVTDDVGDAGPFDLPEGQLYVSIYTGN